MKKTIPIGIEKNSCIYTSSPNNTGGGRPPRSQIIRGDIAIIALINSRMWVDNFDLSMVSLVVGPTPIPDHQ
jgi:hypothetical protein